MSGRGTVFTYTVNHQPFNPAVPVPYVIAIVQLDEQADLRIAAKSLTANPSRSTSAACRGALRTPRVDKDSVFVPVFAPQSG